MYSRHNYVKKHIWNYDESWTQATRNGNGYIFANRGIHCVLIVTPDEREWLFVLSCINALGSSILNFFIFKGRLLRRNFTIKYEEGVVWLCKKKIVDDGSII